MLGSGVLTRRLFMKSNASPKQTKQTKTEPATSTCTRATGCLFLGEVIYAEGHEAGVRLTLHVGRKGRDGGDARVKRSKSRVGLHKESTHALASWGRSSSKIHVHFSVGLSIHAYHHSHSCEQTRERARCTPRRDPGQKNPGPKNAHKLNPPT